MMINNTNVIYANEGRIVDKEIKYTENKLYYEFLVDYTYRGKRKVIPIVVDKGQFYSFHEDEKVIFKIYRDSDIAYLEIAKKDD